jgi:poly(3-hydroxybutyrate) depolymerase
VVVSIALAGCISDDADGVDDGTGGVSGPPAEFLPEPTGTCPGFSDGAGCTADDVSLICTFSPQGLVPRPVRIWRDPAQSGGPLVIFWHGLSRNAGDAVLPGAGLGPDVVADIQLQGGMVASPERSEKRQTTSVTELPWLLALGSGEEDDLLVMDEVVGCAMQEVGIDVRHIHVTGMSAGGLQTGQVGPRRSGYIASIVPYSGGQLGEPPVQDPNNKYAAALFHGGPDDRSC